MIRKVLPLLLMTLGLNLWLTKPVEMTAIAQDTTEKIETPKEESRQRHIVNVVVTSPEDIKVKEGDRIAVGQILADRTQQRQLLEARKKQLSFAIARLMQPVTPPPPPPTPSYAPEESAVNSAQLAIAYWENVPEPDFRFKSMDLVMVMDQKILKEKQSIQLRKMQAQTQLNQAIANLQAAKNNHQNNLYQYQLGLLELEQTQRDREIEALKITEQLAEVDKQIAEVTAIKSPYAGRVRKVEIVNQSGLQINAEITLLIVKTDSPVDSQKTDSIIEETP
jgi:biotin carboxyl carrier protein